MLRGQQTRRGKSNASATISQMWTGTSYLVMSSNISRVEARMFAMTKQEAQYDPSVVTGLLSIVNMDAYILIDYGSPYSFILVEFAQYMNKEVDWLGS